MNTSIECKTVWKKEKNKIKKPKTDPNNHKILGGNLGFIPGLPFFENSQSVFAGENIPNSVRTSDPIQSIKEGLANLSSMNITGGSNRSTNPIVEGFDIDSIKDKINDSTVLANAAENTLVYFDFVMERLATGLCRAFKPVIQGLYVPPNITYNYYLENPFYNDDIAYDVQHIKNYMLSFFAVLLSFYVTRNLYYVMFYKYPTINAESKEPELNLIETNRWNSFSEQTIKPILGWIKYHLFTTGLFDILIKTVVPTGCQVSIDQILNEKLKYVALICLVTFILIRYTRTIFESFIVYARYGTTPENNCDTNPIDTNCTHDYTALFTVCIVLYIFIDQLMFFPTLLMVTGGNVLGAIFGIVILIFILIIFHLITLFIAGIILTLFFISLFFLPWPFVELKRGLPVIRYLKNSRIIDAFIYKKNTEFKIWKPINLVVDFIYKYSYYLIIVGFFIWMMVDGSKRITDNGIKTNFIIYTAVALCGTLFLLFINFVYNDNMKLNLEPYDTGVQVEGDPSKQKTPEEVIAAIFFDKTDEERKLELDRLNWELMNPIEKEWQKTIMKLEDPDYIPPYEKDTSDKKIHIADRLRSFFGADENDYDPESNYFSPTFTDKLAKYNEKYEKDNKGFLDVLNQIKGSLTEAVTKAVVEEASSVMMPGASMIPGGIIPDEAAEGLLSGAISDPDMLSNLASGNPEQMLSSVAKPDMMKGLTQNPMLGDMAKNILPEDITDNLRIGNPDSENETDGPKNTASDDSEERDLSI